MNIKELSDEQKSVMLAKLCGWNINQQDSGKAWITCPDDAYATTNLYRPAFMFLAWRVLNWASSNKSPHPEERDEMQHKMQEWLTYHVGWLDILSPASAQRLWLDKILELAIEAELVNLRAEEREP